MGSTWSVTALGVVASAISVVGACAALQPSRCAPIRRPDGIGSCVDIPMTEAEVAHIDHLKATVPSELDIATVQQDCDHWIEAYRSTPESMPGARAYIDKARFDRCQDAMHGDLARRADAAREADAQSDRDAASKKELDTGCDPGRRTDLEAWAAKIKTTMATKLRYRKCWMVAGLERCDLEAGYDVYTFTPRRKAVDVARPAGAASKPFAVELDAPAPGKELHVMAFGFSPVSIRVDGADAPSPSPFEDKASMTEGADGSWSSVADVPRPHHRTSRVVRSGKPTLTVDGLGCTLVVVFEGSIAPPTGSKPDEAW